MNAGNNNKKKLKFLNEILQMSEEDRTDPTLLMLIAQVEMVELLKGGGLAWWRHLKNDYKFKIQLQLDLQIENILISNNLTYEEFLARHKG